MKALKLLFLFTLSFMVITSCSDKGIDPENSEDPNETPTNAEFYITYKINAENYSIVDSKALRGTDDGNNTLGLEGTGKDGAHPQFSFYTSGSFIGIVAGLNIGSINAQNSSDQYLEITTKDGVLYSSKNDAEGCDLTVTSVTYEKGGTVVGKFSGFVSSADNKRLEIKDGLYKVKFTN